jgi:hypothetical protein
MRGKLGSLLATVENQASRDVATGLPLDRRQHSHRLSQLPINGEPVGFGR